MDLAKPYTAVVAGAHGDVLRVLCASTRPFTGREVARLAGRPHTTVQKSLDRLVEHGLATRTAAGRAGLYALNREHLAAGAVEALAKLRTVLIARIRSTLATWEPAPAHASLFGSAARGDGATASDIDILLVRPDAVSPEDDRWREQVERLSSEVSSWTGNHLAAVEVTESELDRMRRDRPPLVEELRADAVVLVGPEIRKLVGPR